MQMRNLRPLINAIQFGRIATAHVIMQIGRAHISTNGRFSIYSAARAAALLSVPPSLRLETPFLGGLWSDPE